MYATSFHSDAGVVADNVTAGFVETFHVGVCRGRYSKPLVKAWQAWDKTHGSLNDPVAGLAPDQTFVVIGMADSGTDLEAFKIESFAQARSLLLQVRGARWQSLAMA